MRRFGFSCGHGQCGGGCSCFAAVAHDMPHGEELVYCGASRCSTSGATIRSWGCARAATRRRYTWGTLPLGIFYNGLVGAMSLSTRMGGGVSVDEVRGADEAGSELCAEDDRAIIGRCHREAVIAIECRGGVFHMRPDEGVAIGGCNAPREFNQVFNKATRRWNVVAYTQGGAGELLAACCCSRLVTDLAIFHVRRRHPAEEHRPRLIRVRCDDGGGAQRGIGGRAHGLLLQTELDQEGGRVHRSRCGGEGGDAVLVLRRGRVVFGHLVRICYYQRHRGLNGSQQIRLPASTEDDDVCEDDVCRTSCYCERGGADVLSRGTCFRARCKRSMDLGQGRAHRESNMRRTFKARGGKGCQHRFV